MQDGRMWDFVKVAKQKRSNHKNMLDHQMAEDEDPKESLRELHAILFGFDKNEESKERVMSPNDQESMDILDEELLLSKQIRSHSLSGNTLNDPVQAKRAKVQESSYQLER